MFIGRATILVLKSFINFYPLRGYGKSNVVRLLGKIILDVRIINIGTKKSS